MEIDRRPGVHWTRSAARLARTAAEAFQSPAGRQIRRQLFTPRATPMRNGNPTDVRHQSRSNASDLIDQYHPDAVLKQRHKKKKRSKKSKKASKKKRTFKKKVERIIHKLDAPVFLTEFTGVQFFQALGAANWNAGPTQTITYSLANQSLRMWIGGEAATSFPLSQTYDIQRLANMLKTVVPTLFTNLASGSNTSTAGTKILVSPPTKVQFWISQYTYDISLQNQQLVPITYDIYEWVAARHMGGDDPYNTVSNATTQCLADMNIAGYNLGSTSAVISTLNNLGQNQTMLPGFNKHWKLEQSTRVLLQPSSSTCLTINGPTGWYDQIKNASVTSIAGKTKEITVIAGASIGFGWPATTVPGQYVVTKKIKARFPQEWGVSSQIPLSMVQSI